MRDRESGAGGPGLRRRSGGASGRGTPRSCCFRNRSPHWLHESRSPRPRHGPTLSSTRFRPVIRTAAPTVTSRSLYEQLQALADLVSGSSVRVVFAADEGVRRDLGVIIVVATERIIADSEMSSDDHRWLRTGRRGHPGAAGRSDARRLRRPPLSPPLPASCYPIPARRPRIGSGSMPRGKCTPRPRRSWVCILGARSDGHGPRDRGRACLAAAAPGGDGARFTAAQPLDQPVEMMDRRRMLNRQDEFGPALARMARADSSGADLRVPARLRGEGGATLAAPATRSGRPFSAAT